MCFNALEFTSSCIGNNTYAHRANTQSATLNNTTYHDVARHRTFSNIDQVAVYVNQPENILSKTEISNEETKVVPSSIEILICFLLKLTSTNKTNQL